MELAPRKKEKLEVRYGRDPIDVETLVLPQLEFQVDYLAPGSRVSLPERVHAVRWKLATLPPTAIDGTMRRASAVTPSTIP